MDKKSSGKDKRRIFGKWTSVAVRSHLAAVVNPFFFFPAAPVSFPLPLFPPRLVFARGPMEGRRRRLHQQFFANGANTSRSNETCGNSSSNNSNSSSSNHDSNNIAYKIRLCSSSPCRCSRRRRRCRRYPLHPLPLKLSLLVPQDLNLLAQLRMRELVSRGPRRVAR